MAGVAGVPEGEGSRLSPRIVDDPASRPSRSRARTGAGTCVPRQSGAGHGEILDQDEVKPHKVRYYLEQRDPDFAEKMAEVLCVYRQVKSSSRRRPCERRTCLAISGADQVARSRAYEGWMGSRGAKSLSAPAYRRA
jgi:hypothetical protein